MTRLSGILVATLLFVLAACQYADPNTTYPRSRQGSGGGTYEPSQSVFGGDGVTIFSFGDEKDEGARGSGIGVNSFLWRAALDTLSFMPLVSADPFGGVIITDWHRPTETPDERFKIDTYILGRDLRADGLRVAVFRQRLQGDGTWIDAPVQPQTAVDLENAILTRARQLRVAGLQ